MWFQKATLALKYQFLAFFSVQPQSFEENVHNSSSRLEKPKHICLIDDINATHFFSPKGYCFYLVTWCFTVQSLVLGKLQEGTLGGLEPAFLLLSHQNRLPKDGFRQTQCRVVLLGLKKPIGRTKELMGLLRIIVQLLIHRIDGSMAPQQIDASNRNSATASLQKKKHALVFNDLMRFTTVKCRMKQCTVFAESMAMSIVHYSPCSHDV